MVIRLKTAIFWIVVAGAFAYGLGWHLSRTDISVLSTDVGPTLRITQKEPPAHLSDVNLGLFWEVWDHLEKQYIDKTAVNRQKMVEGAISGMVSSLGDPYTTFLPPQQNKTAKEELEGSFEGVGIQLGFKDKRLVVVAAIFDTPASKAGVKPGDFIVKIDGKETAIITMPDAVSKIRGPRGSTVALTIMRESEVKPLEFTLTRDKIRIKSVDVSFFDHVAYIKLSRFGDTTSEEWNNAVREVLAKNAQALVLDVRNNPGGYLDGAVVIGGEFFEEGSIVQKEHSSGKKEIRSVQRPGRLASVPVVVLINKGSASASEIVAGAIADRKRGILVGEQSFGKGSIQEVIELPKGAGLHITTERWLLPSGAWVNGSGITPDIVVASSDKEGEDPQLDRALAEARKRIASSGSSWIE